MWVRLMGLWADFLGGTLGPAVGPGPVPSSACSSAIGRLGMTRVLTGRAGVWTKVLTKGHAQQVLPVTPAVAAGFLIIKSTNRSR